MYRILARLLFLPTLGWNLLLARVLPLRTWWSWIDEQVLVGALPFASDVPALKEAGVRAVVNTCEEYRGPVQAYERAGIVQLRVPTIDFDPPSLEDIERAVQFIEHHVGRGESVYVHCKAGRARSATVALCWLIATKGMTPQEGQAHLLEKRPHVNRNLARRTVVQKFWSRRQEGTTR